MISIKRIFIPLTILLLSSMSLAEDITPEIRAVENSRERMPHIGLSAGVGNPEGSLTNGRNYALEFGFQSVIPFSVTGELSAAEYSDGPNQLSRTTILLKGAYNFGGTTPIIRHSYVGVGLGPVWEERGETSSGMGVAVMPNTGFDYPLKKFIELPLSVGANLSYLVSSRGTPGVFATNAVVKYWY